MILEIPRVPASPNVFLGKHWRHRHRNSLTWQQEIYYALVGMALPEHPYPKARVSIERRSRGILDPDNLVGSVKPVIDALRYARVLFDDSPDHLELEVTQSRGAPLTRIQVQPL